MNDSINILSDSIGLPLSIAEKTAVVFDGKAFCEPLIYSDSFTMLIILASLVLSFFIYLNNKEKNTARLFSGRYLITSALILFGILGYSCFIAYLLNVLETPIKWLNFATIYGIIMLFILAKLFVTKFYLSIFFKKYIDQFIFYYVNILGISGLAFFILFIFSTFSCFDTSFLWIIIGTILIISTEVLISYFLIRNFFNQIRYILHFIVYLCTLEILPVLIALKFLLSNNL